MPALPGSSVSSELPILDSSSSSSSSTNAHALLTSQSGLSSTLQNVISHSDGLNLHQQGISRSRGGRHKDVPNNHIPLCWWAIKDNSQSSSPSVLQPLIQLDQIHRDKTCAIMTSCINVDQPDILLATYNIDLEYQSSSYHSAFNLVHGTFPPRFIKHLACEVALFRVQKHRTCLGFFLNGEILGLKEILQTKNEPVISSHQAALDHVLLNHASVLSLNAWFAFDSHENNAFRGIRLQVSCSDPAQEKMLRQSLLLDWIPKQRDAAWLLKCHYQPPSYSNLAGLQCLMNQDSMTVQFPSVFYHFQERAISWMLDRENLICASQDGKLSIQPISEQRHLFDARVTSLIQSANPFQASFNMLGCSQDARPNTLFTGGILSDEMGLGKTLDVLALVTLHSLATTPQERKAEFLAKAKSLNVPPVKATLVAAPPVLIDQWKSEIKKHAPLLTVIEYTGTQTPNEIAACDIVLISYTVISRQLWFAAPDSDRPRRADRKYERARCALVKVLWWRVCLDEGQVIDSPYRKTTVVASALHRMHSWCVTGTPFSNDFTDILGLLRFVGAPYVKLNERSDGAFFYSFMCRVMHRNTKAIVKDEWKIPSQFEQSVFLTFPTIEKMWYAEQFERAKCELGMGPLSIVASLYSTLSRDDFDQVLMDQDEKVRYDREEEPYIDKDKLNSWFLKLRQLCVAPQTGLPTRRRAIDPSRSVHAVMDQLRKDNLAKYYSNLRSKFITNIELAFTYHNEGVSRKAKEMMMELIAPACKILETVHAEYLKEKAEREVTKASENSGKGATGSHEAKAEDEDGDEDSTWQARLLSWRDVMHRIYFFLGSLCNSTEGSEEEEGHFYMEAQKIRMAVLEIDMIRWRKWLVALNKTPDLNFEAMRIPAPYSYKFEVCELINEQLLLLVEWRSQIQTGLRVDLDDDYDKGVQHQSKLAQTEDAFKEILCFLQESLVGVARPFFPSNKDPLELAMNRKRMVRLSAKDGFLRAVIQELASRTPETAAALNQHYRRLSDLMETLDSERHSIARLFNARVMFYKRLQRISDSVMLPDVPFRTRPRLVKKL